MGRPLAHDLVGRTFGYLLVLRRSARKASYPYWECVCVCGAHAEVASHNLRRGQDHSCGCKTAEVRSAALRGKNVTHGHTRAGKVPPEYSVWCGMRKRCKDEHNKNYGARGIKVCRRWESFDAFLEDMGPRPSARHSLERKFTDGNYTPANCVWATAKEQQNNKRSNRRFTFLGRTQTLAQWSDEVGLSRSTLWRRLVLWGWSPERALTTPAIPPRLRSAGVTGAILG